MTINLTRREQLVSSLEDKEYRDAFVADQIRIGVPLQIKMMRDERDWTQEVLGQGMTPPMMQESVWRLENPNKANLTIGTLLRVASAFDVALMVRFVPFSELIDSTPWLSGTDRSIPEYAKDSGLRKTAAAPRVVNLMDALNKAAIGATKETSSSTVVDPRTRFTLEAIRENKVA